MAKAKKTTQPTAEVCLRPGCGRPASTRGLCKSCYGSARGLIKSGAVTEEALIKAGKLLAPSRGAVREWLTT